jgi:uncharacterized membrane protein YhaH (DUF805 family)
MSKDLNETVSMELSLQPQVISPQPRVIVCPKCQHKRTPNDPGPEWQCPSCGIAYNKASPPSGTVVHQVDSAPRARARREVDRDELETATPSAISLSLKGRVGRLRYLAYLWPTMVLTGLLMLLAVSPGSLGKTPTIFFAILFCALWIWVPLRSMALRMHDLDQSAGWLLVFIFFPGVFFALGKPQVGAMCSSFFWLAALLLIVVPGSESANRYGPPPDANTTLVKVGAGVMLAFMAVMVVGDIKLIRSGQLHSPLFAARNPAQEQHGPATGPHSAAADTQNAGRLAMSDFVGLWQNEHMGLRVDTVGNALFYHLDGNISVRATGPLRILDDSHISIGTGANAVVLNVTEPPHMEGQVLKMTLDGVELGWNR